MNSIVLDEIRREASLQLDPARRSALGQFMTPSSIAHFMAGLFSPTTGSVCLLDAGAGVGSLTSAFIDSHPGTAVRVEAWEVEPLLREYLQATLSRCVAGGAVLDAVVHADDFIETSAWNLSMGVGTRFTHAILNPPYKKIGSNSRHRLLLRQAGIETIAPDSFQRHAFSWPLFVMQGSISLS